MGCCSSNKYSTESFLFAKKLQDAIDRCNLKELSEIWSTIPVNKLDQGFINEPIFTEHEFRLSPLAYALWKGKLASFQYLHKRLGASLEEMKKLLADQGKKPIDVICVHGSLEMLQYYLPFYMDCDRNEARTVLGEDCVSVDFQRSTLVQAKNLNTYSPVHIACENGHVQIVSHLFITFKNSDAIPWMFDVNYQDEVSGENCALIACRKGDYKMVKLLNEVCKANFNVFNQRHENAIQITAASSKRRPAHDFYHLFVYLIEVVKLDFTYNYEEVILLLEDKNILRFYQNKLQKAGINIEKNKIEKKYEIVRPDYPVTREEQIIEKMGENFQIRRCLEETGDNTVSILSSIKDHEADMTPFMSTLTLNGKNN